MYTHVMFMHHDQGVSFGNDIEFCASPNFLYTHTHLDAIVIKYIAFLYSILLAAYKLNEMVDFEFCDMHGFQASRCC